MKPEPVIEVRKLSKSFKDVKAVRDVNLSIGKGEFVALLGPNGAGKTTLVEMIEGIQHPDCGQILLKGRPWKSNEDELHRILGLSFQDTRFIDRLTVKETVRLFASFYGLPHSREEEIINIIRLAEKQKSYVMNLSGGQRQRLALGIALLNKPEILLLDEPTTGLDPKARHEIWDILKQLKAQGNTSLILTTHYMEEAELLCERIIVMNQGQILAEGTLDQILAMDGDNEIIEFSCDSNIEPDIFRDIDGISKLNWNEVTRQCEIRVRHTVEVLPRIAEVLKSRNINILSLTCRKTTLDDLFIKMTGRKILDEN